MVVEVKQCGDGGSKTVRCGRGKVKGGGGAVCAWTQS